MTDDTDTAAPPDWWPTKPAKPPPPAYCRDCRVQLTVARAGRNLRCEPCWDALIDAQPALQAEVPFDPRGPLCSSCRATADGCAARARGGYGRRCRGCTHHPGGVGGSESPRLCGADNPPQVIGLPTACFTREGGRRGNHPT